MRRATMEATSRSFSGARCGLVSDLTRLNRGVREIRARYDGDIPVATRVVRVRARVRVRVRLTLTLTPTKTYQLPPAWRRVVRRRSASSVTTAYEGDMREI